MSLLVTHKQRFTNKQQYSDGKKVLQLYLSYKLTSVSLVEMTECIPHIKTINTFEYYWLMALFKWK